ncbi:hypothetical protein PYCC9005_005305 [Savitreella phatthalungensis]
MLAEAREGAASDDRFILTHAQTPFLDLVHPSLRHHVQTHTQDFQDAISGIYLPRNTTPSLLASLKAHRGFLTADNPQLRPAAMEMQVDASWALKRISRPGRLNVPSPARTFFQYAFDDEWQGADAVIWVIDSGVDSGNPDFGERVLVSPRSQHKQMLARTDSTGHGTAVAGASASTRHGIARSAWIRPVKVLDNYLRGNVLDVISLVTPIRTAGWKLANKRNAVQIVVFAATVPINPALDVAITKLDHSGFVVVVPASNEPIDACILSPSHLNEVITVAGTTTKDTLLAGSGYGACVDILAPGQSVRVPGIHGLPARPFALNRPVPRAQSVWTGTSIAAGFVAGAIAIYLNPLRRLSTRPEPNYGVSLSTLARSYLEVSSIELPDQIVSEGLPTSQDIHYMLRGSGYSHLSPDGRMRNDMPDSEAYVVGRVFPEDALKQAADLYTAWASRARHSTTRRFLQTSLKHNFEPLEIPRDPAAQRAYCDEQADFNESVESALCELDRERAERAHERERKRPRPSEQAHQLLHARPPIPPEYRPVRPKLIRPQHS